MKPTPYANIPFRVAAYNKRIKTEAAKIYLKPGANENSEFSYTSKLYQEYEEKGAELIIEDGVYKFELTENGYYSLNIVAMNFLQVLVYLEYYDNWQKAEDERVEEALRKKAEAKAQKERTKQTSAESKGFELIEEDGVTKIKGTNFVISKFL